MERDEWEYLLNCEPSAFYKWLWSKMSKKQISKAQWFTLSSTYERHNTGNTGQLEKDIEDVFGLDK